MQNCWSTSFQCQLLPILGTLSSEVPGAPYQSYPCAAGTHPNSRRAFLTAGIFLRFTQKGVGVPLAGQ